MVCSPQDNSLNPSEFPGFSIPGFGSPFSPIPFPLPEFDLPLDIIEDLVDLMNKIGALFPSGLFKPNPDNFMKQALDFIMNILNQIAPYISLYNLFFAALKLIACIIEVLCAIPDPFAVAFKLKKLFAECLPPFLNIFPWMALLAMLIALLLLILALLEYLLNTLLGIIKELLANIILFGKVVTLQDEQATLSIAQKIASLFCYIENLMTVFVAIAAIMAIIESLSKLGGFSICSDEDTDAAGCCNAENCPPFIANNPDGITGTSGRLVYFHRIESDIATLLGVPAGSLTLDPLRIERWQLINDASSQLYPFSSIITPVNTTTEKIYFPDIEFDSTTPTSRSPYLVDLRFLVNPAVFGHTDTLGVRYMRAKNCIVVRKPYLGEYDYENNLITTNVTGTLNLEGGKIYEDDGTTPYIVNTQHASLNKFLHIDKESSISLPASDDGYVISDVEFNLKPNHEALVFHNLITVGCFPGLSVERAVQNAVISSEGLESVGDKLDLANLLPNGGFPDILGTQACVLNALAELRKDVSEANIAKFQASAETCLGNLADDVTKMYTQAVIVSTSVFKSTISLDTDLQFTTRSIEVSISLRDPNGTIISGSIPDNSITDILDKISASVTLGDITDFIYDGSSSFIAYITSSKSGDGYLSAFFDGKVFNTVTIGTDLDTPSVIAENLIPYTFVDDVSQGAVRRDQTDIANDRNRS